MTVYEKLNNARIRFQESNVRKSGKNKFAGYDYFELSDILPVVNRICNDLKATCVVTFSSDMATLEFIDCEQPDARVMFTSPMSTASLKGCHEVQNLGAVESYIKRYLYQNCFEISEHDALDSTMNPNERNGGCSGQGRGNRSAGDTGGIMSAVMDIINSGELPEQWTVRADHIIRSNDIDGAKKLIEWYNGRTAG